MSTRASRLWTLCLLLPLAAACGRADRSPAVARDGTAIESPRSGDREKSSLVMAGQLRTVDPSRQTLIVAFGDDLYEFAYNDETEVVGGTTSVQGLTGNRGNEVTVHYRQNPITSTKTAVRIELQ
ncbi:MAG TPA: hypothetical protein VMS40_26105 [Vicinamibacterales bacterium]|nr:hypothetical protein [Vicinamibacterales bacterium]